jgi:LemA protein
MNPGVFLVIPVAAGVGATFLVRKRWRFTDTPTSEAAHVFPGLGEVHGLVEAIGSPLKAASDSADCVWWHYTVEQEHRDTKNNTSSWSTEEEGVSAIPFHIRDSSGAVRVILTDATSVDRASSNDVEHLSLNKLRSHALTMKTIYEPGAIAKALGSVFGSNEPDEAIDDFSGRWRASESRLLVGDEVFLTAHARLTESGAEVEFAPTDSQGKGRTFELTVGNEKSAMGSNASAWLIALLVAVCVISNQLSGPAGLASTLAVTALAALVVWVIGAYNRVHRARGRGEFAWSLIDVACEQRSQTITQLNTVVHAALANEGAVMMQIASVRGLGRKPTPEMTTAVQQSADASEKFVARAEALPTLTSQPNVAQLISQLRLLNDRVAFSRRFYNDSVTRLHNRLTQFPDSAIAKAAGVQALPLLDG